MAPLIDPTVTGNYPVILGDGLLGKTSNEIFTGIRYNHKPALSQDAAARLKPSIPGKTSSYDLSFSDNDDKYAFAGTRTTDDDQYVLYFDAERQAFVLDKIDSTFNMNVTRLPNITNPETLRRQYPHIDSDRKPKTNAPSRPANKEKQNRSSKARAASPFAESSRRKPEKKQSEKTRLSLPQQADRAQQKTKSKPPQKAQPDDEDEEEDDDGGLLIEYPGADPKSQNKQKDFSPAFAAVRRFDDFMDQRESGADDAEGDSDLERDELRLPSPGHKDEGMRAAAEEPRGYDSDMDKDHEEGEGSTVDDDLDLEKDLEDAFENIGNSPQGTPHDDESEISEED